MIILMLLLAPFVAHAHRRVVLVNRVTNTAAINAACSGGLWRIDVLSARSAKEACGAVAFCAVADRVLLVAPQGTERRKASVVRARLRALALGAEWAFSTGARILA